MSTKAASPSTDFLSTFITFRLTYLFQPGSSATFAFSSEGSFARVVIRTSLYCETLTCAVVLARFNHSDMSSQADNQVPSAADLSFKAEMDLMKQKWQFLEQEVIRLDAEKAASSTVLTGSSDSESRAEVVQLRQELETKSARIEQLEHQVSELENDLTAKDATIAQLEGSKSELMRVLISARDKLSEHINTEGNGQHPAEEPEPREDSAPKASMPDTGKTNQSASETSPLTSERPILVEDSGEIASTTVPDESTVESSQTKPPPTTTASGTTPLASNRPTFANASKAISFNDAWDDFMAERSQAEGLPASKWIGRTDFDVNTERAQKTAMPVMVSSATRSPLASESSQSGQPSPVPSVLASPKRGRSPRASPPSWIGGESSANGRGTRGYQRGQGRRPTWRGYGGRRGRSSFWRPREDR